MGVRAEVQGGPRTEDSALSTGRDAVTGRPCGLPPAMHVADLQFDHSKVGRLTWSHLVFCKKHVKTAGCLVKT